MQVLPQRAVPEGQAGVPPVGVGVCPLLVGVGVAVGGPPVGGCPGAFGAPELWASVLTTSSAPNPTAATAVRPTRTVRRDKPRAALPT
jgi:hypothetical protein